MPYPYVHVTNSTPYKCTGKVKYAACESDEYTVEPGKTWIADSRGLCLLTAVGAMVHTSDGQVRADDYTSSGTSYSRFLIGQMGDGYIVTRVVNTPEGEAEEQVIEMAE